MYNLGRYIATRQPYLARWAGTLVAGLASLALAHLAGGGGWWAAWGAAALAGVAVGALPRPARDWGIALLPTVVGLPGVVGRSPGLVGCGLAVFAGVFLARALRGSRW